MFKYESIFLNLDAGEGVKFINGKFETKDKKQVEYLKQFSFIRLVFDKPEGQ